MRFGSFDNEKKEYVITRPDTPLPWINYLGSRKYCALISNTAGGYSFYIDPRENRILRYRYDNVPFDRGGRYLYIKDNQTGEFFSPTWQPVMKELDKFECRHGLGYTIISSECLKILSKITYLVPLGEDLEIWKMEIENLEKASREITIFSCVEFCLWDAVGDASNFQRTWSIGKAHCEGSTIIHDTLYGSWKDILAFFSTSEKVHSYDCQRKNFLGSEGYNSLEKPAAVLKGKGSNSEAIGWSPIGSHCIKLKLKPGQKKTIIFVLGIADSIQKSKAKSQKFATVEVADQELAKIKEFWRENTSKIQVNTPDKEMNTMLNIWNQYQCRTTFNWSRYASYYESGIGRAMGFRDCCQDLMGFVYMLPERARERILDLASIQFEDGSTYHQYSPITKKGDLLGYSDDPLWLVLAADAYLRETGDFSVLKEIVPFEELDHYRHIQVGHHDYVCKPQAEEKKKINATLYEHLKRAVFYSWKNVGPHGLPKAGFADWNDCLNMVGPKGKAESVFVAAMLVKASKIMTQLARNGDHNFFKEISIEMKKRIARSAWDGSWYLRAFDDSGKKVGSKKCKEARIFLESQAAAVMFEAADEKRGKKCLDSVYRHLFTKFGIKLLDPAFVTYHPELGEISTYPAGLKENGSIFCHPNPWVMVAECMLGRGDRAYEYYRALLPAAQNDRAQIRKTEPYVYCQMVAGPEHPDFGEGKNSWLTGSASWNLIAATQGILGIKPAYEGLMINPCIPAKWNGFEAERTFRGDRYLIRVKNPKHVCSGVKLLKVDGQKLHENLVKPFGDKKLHLIEVELG